MFAWNTMYELEFCLINLMSERLKVGGGMIILTITLRVFIHGVLK